VRRLLYALPLVALGGLPRPRVPPLWAAARAAPSPGSKREEPLGCSVYRPLIPEEESSAEGLLHSIPANLQGPYTMAVRCYGAGLTPLSQRVKLSTFCRKTLEGVRPRNLRTRTGAGVLRIHPEEPRVTFC
jgi:hypothetical protein